jgi:hypothetical protein
MRLSDLLGLQVDRSSHQAVETTYAHQPESLLKFTYGEVVRTGNLIFCTANKCV